MNQSKTMFEMVCISQEKPVSCMHLNKSAKFTQQSQQVIKRPGLEISQNNKCCHLKSALRVCVLTH